MSEPLIIVGFGSSKGQKSTVFFQDKYQKVERFGMKLQITLPTLKSKSNGEVNLNHLSTIMGHRRSEPLLRSFLKNQDEEQAFDFLQIQEFAQKEIKNLNEELNTIDMLKEQLKVQKFANQTNSTDQVARQYLAQFHNDHNKAVQVYKQRKQIIKKFAEKNKMTQQQAYNILKDNGYNASLFD